MINPIETLNEYYYQSSQDEYDGWREFAREEVIAIESRCLANNARKMCTTVGTSVIALMAVAMFASTGWAAEDTGLSKHQSIRISGGAVIGGVTGGPVGLVVGATLGTWLGDRFDEERNARTQFEQRWIEAEEEVAALNDLVASSEHQVAVLESQIHQENREMQNTLRDALDVQVLFRTNESTLPDETQNRLLRLAGLLAHLDGTLTHIEGHADSRGHQEHNDQLSAQRATFVRDLLIEAGVPLNRIMIDGYGETYASAEENDVDSMAMERRVDLTLIRNGSENRVAQK